MALNGMKRVNNGFTNSKENRTVADQLTYSKPAYLAQFLE